MASKIFIKRQQERLEKERQKILKQIEDFKKEDPFTDPDHALDNAAIDTDVREQVGHETIEAQMKDLRIRLREIDYALEKIKKNQYVQCDSCKKNISQARLKLIPEARYCIDCEKKIRVG